jgi:apolipoprotein D and lipocalin family protein
MGKHGHKLAEALAACALTLALPVAASAQAATAIPKLDLNRMAGTWFELYHLPNKAEKKCVSDATVLYALGDKAGRLQIVSTCLLQDSATNVRNMDARLADKSGDGKLKIPGFLPYFLAKKLWVFAAGPEYEWLLMGAPNHKTLWVLSKTETLPDGVMAGIQAKAAAEGFAVAKLVQIPRTQ